GWRSTFPRGFAAESAEFVRRLPRRFYGALVGLIACVALAAVALELGSGLLGGWTFVLLAGAAIGVAVAVRRMVRFGSVAIASPERRKASERVAIPTEIANPMQSNWNQAVPTPVDAGQELPVRLRGNVISERLILAGAFTLFGALLIATVT